jgi:hypothetical protein
MSPLPGRRWVKIDPYAIRDLAREHLLDEQTRWLLVWLTLGADPRSHRFTGTLGDLADDVGMGRKTVRERYDRLEQRGLVKTVEPFRPNAQGVVLVCAYPHLVVLGSRAPRGSTTWVRWLHGDTNVRPDEDAITPDGQRPNLRSVQ